MFVHAPNGAFAPSGTMSSLISGSELSQQAPEPGSDASGQDQYVAASSRQSIKAAPGLPYVSSPKVDNMSSLFS